MTRPSVVVAMVNASLGGSSAHCIHHDHLEAQANCFPDLWPDFTAFAVQLLVPGYEARYVPVIKYGDVGISTENDSDSIIGRLLTGDADLSPPFMSIQRNRLAKLNFIGPLLKAKLFVAYSRGILTAPASLDLGNLYPNFILIPLLTAGLVYGLCNGSYRLFHCVGAEWGSRFHRRALLLLIFFYGVFIGVFKTHLVVFFNLPAPAAALIRSKEELLTALEAGTVTAVTNTPVYLRTLLKPVDYANESETAARFLRAAQTNPPRLSDEDPNLLRDIFDPAHSNSNARFVFVSDSYYLAYLSPMYCNFEYYYFMDDPPMSLGMYQSRSSKVRVKRPTTVESKVIEAEYQRLLYSYSRKNCPREDSEAPRTPFTISLGQLNGVLLTVAGLLSAAGLVFLIETLGGALKSILSPNTGLRARLKRAPTPTNWARLGSYPDIAAFGLARPRHVHVREVGAT